MTSFLGSWSREHTHVHPSSVAFNFTVNGCEVHLSAQVRNLNAFVKIMMLMIFVLISRIPFLKKM